MGVKADIPIGVEVADRDGIPAGWKNLFNPIIPEEGDVVWDLWIGSGAAEKSVMSFRGAFLGVILRVARGFVGELMESLRVKAAMVPRGSLSDEDLEWEGVRLR
jgi:hypothetical protein